MSVRFKFRSSASFNSVEIEGGRGLSISVRDLKSKIIRYKNLDVSHDFDLLLSDAVSGQEYGDEDDQIPSGASVIIKRVPAGSPRPDGAYADSLGNAGIKGESRVKCCSPVNVEIDNLDDFGDDLPTLAAARSSYGVDVDKKLNIMNEKTNVEVPRCFEKSLIVCQKHEVSDFSEAIPGGTFPIGKEEKTLNSKPKPSVEEHKNVVNGNPEALQNAHIPSELKCSLCDDFFKEAVMIPCCQHSFCEKCIYAVLVQKHKCPRCLSTKPTVEDLLPNVSLRQAIGRFLKSHFIIQGSEHALDQYASDGESGIQISCAMSYHQRQSPSATSGGSNQINADPNGGRLALSSYFHRETDGKRHDLVNPVNTEDLGTDFQGENQSIVGEEESQFMKKQALWVNRTGTEKNFVERGWYKKGARTCYMCGSPNHLVRDCPATMSPHSMFPMGAMPGYASTGWSGILYPQISPFGSPCCNPGILPFHAVMVPAFTGPTCMPPMFGTMPAYRAFTRIGGSSVGSVAGAEWHQDHPSYMERQGSEKRQKLSLDNSRGRFSDNEEDKGLNIGIRYEKAKRASSHDYVRGREEGASYSNDSSNRRSHQKCLLHNYLEDDTERSGSEVEDMPRSSKWHGEKWRNSDRKNGERHSCREEQHGSDSSHSRLCGKKAEEIKRDGSWSDIKRDQQKHRSHSDAVMEPRNRAKETSRGSRHSRHSRSVNDEQGNERWLMARGSEDDGEGDFYYSRLKRAY